MKRSIPFGKERDDFSLSINMKRSIRWHFFAINKEYLMKKCIPFGKERDDFSNKQYLMKRIWKGEGWLLTINKQYLMKKSIPFGKEGNDFSLSINSIWWNVYSIWKGDGLFAINKQCLMKGKERDDFSLSINSIWWKALFHLERRGMTFRYQ